MLDEIKILYCWLLNLKHQHTIESVKDTAHAVGTLGFNNNENKYVNSNLVLDFISKYEINVRRN